MAAILFCMEKTQNKHCFVVIADGFSKINLHMESKQVTRVFSFMGLKKQETTETPLPVKN